MTSPFPQPNYFQSLSWRKLWLPIFAMIAVITMSNIMVQFVINDWLTWGAFTYPFIFLVTDLTNRAVGPRNARRVVYAGFAAAIIVSLLLAPWRIAVASCSAFIASQLMDIAIFNQWRQATWWKAPLISAIISSFADTMIFFFIAFAGEQGINWLKLGFGDVSFKWLMAAFLLVPYKALLPYIYAYLQKQNVIPNK